MTSLICGDRMPCSARKSATRQSSRVSSAGVSWCRAKMRGSNFQLHPPATARIEVLATCSAMYGRQGWSGIGWNRATAASGDG